MPLIPGPVPGESTEQRLARLEKSLKTLSDFAAQALATTSMFQGRPADATLQVPHNDSWIFEDNVDATHAANMRYIISKNVTRVISARLSIFMAPYRTYNTSSGANTGIESGNHNHGHSHTDSHTHNISILGGGAPATLGTNGSGGASIYDINAGGNFTTGNIVGGQSSTTTSSDSTGQSADHTHPLNITQTLGVTEGTTATGVTVAFDGVDRTAALGGPFNADVIELDVRRFIGVTQGVKHTIAMTPSGNGRIEAHLRFGVYVAAGQTL